MKSPDRVMLMLAASDIEPSELHQFFRSIEKSRASEATDFVLELRRHAKDFRYLGRPKMPLGPVRRLEAPKNLGREVQRQLATLNLPNHQAFELLQKEFRSMGLTARDLPSYNKISLSVWLDRIGRRVGADKLVQATSNILSRHSPRPPIDWPLKREAQ